jgi:hypothetical protein
MRVSTYALLAAPLVIIQATAAYGAETTAKQPPVIASVGDSVACDAYGPGFVSLADVSTCIRIGGLVRVLEQYNPGHSVYNVATGKVSQLASAQDTSGMEVRGRIDLDSRTETAWGTLQTVIWLRGTNTDGLRNAAAATQFSPSITPGNNGATSIIMERAYVKFAGVTAGVGSENFSTIPDYMYGPAVYAGFPNGVKQVAYTSDSGGGFSSTIALESKDDMGGNNVTAGDGSPLGPSVVPYATAVQYSDQLDNTAVLIGTLRDDAKWGFIQGNVALANNTINGTTLTSTYNPLNSPKSSLAWAAGFSVRYLMPSIAPGDEFRFQFAFDNGLIGLIKSAGSLNDFSDATMKRGIGGVITVPQNMIPTAVTATGVVTGVGQSTSYGVMGMYTHYWSPQWRTNADAGYMQIFMPKALSTGVGAGLNTQAGNANVFVGGANLIWSPAKGWDIGAELDYMYMAQGIQNPDAAFVAAGSPGLKGDAATLILRLNRIF